MSNQIISAIILGLIGGLIPGPVLAATFTQILQAGFFSSLRIVLWAMLTETVVALVSLLILSSFGLSQSFFMGLSFIGAGILIWISWSIWRIRRIDTEEKVYFGLGKISAMIIANGVLWTFWITVCIPKAILLSQKVYYGQFLFLLLVEIGWLISTATVALLFSSFRKLLSNPRVVPIMFKVFSLVFLYFAVSMIYQSIIFFIKK